MFSLICFKCTLTFAHKTYLSDKSCVVRAHIYWRMIYLNEAALYGRLVGAYAMSIRLKKYKTGELNIDDLMKIAGKPRCAVNKFNKHLIGWKIDEKSDFPHELQHPPILFNVFRIFATISTITFLMERRIREIQIDR